MRDGPGRTLVKAAARRVFTAEVALRRAVQRARGRHPAHELTGDCNRCGMCCERPELQVGILVFHLPLLRRVFLWWQEAVNRWTVVAADPRTRTFAFTCAHFDREQRTCDSYHSRPAVCRDYPRSLADQPDPVMIPECSYRPVARGGERLLQLLDARGLTPEQRERLVRDLRLR